MNKKLLSVGFVGLCLLALPACCEVNKLVILEKPESFKVSMLVDSVVDIRILGVDGKPKGGGSGIILPGNLVLTARHVTENDPNAIIVAYSDSMKLQSPLKLLKSGLNEEADDWSLLRMELPFGKPCELPDPGLQLERYSKVYAVGYPIWSEIAVITEGRYQGKAYGLLRTTAPIIYGNSGGGLFTLANGKPVLIGINTRIHLVNLSVPIPHMALAVDVCELVKNKRL